MWVSLLVIPQPQANGLTGVTLTEHFNLKKPVHFTKEHKWYIEVDGQSNVVPIQCEKGLTSKLSGTNVIGGLFETWVKKNSVIGEEFSNIFDYQEVYKNLH